MKVVSVKIFHVQQAFDVNLKHSFFSNSFTSLILSLLTVFTKSLGSMPDIITCWTDFETSVNATHIEQFAMLDASL